MTKRFLAIFALFCASGLVSAQSNMPILQPHVTFVTSTGLPCAGCKLYSYAAGTSTPLATYSDCVSPSSPQNPNPTVLDPAGGATICMGSAPYKFVLQTSTGATIWTVDNVPSQFLAANGCSTSATGNITCSGSGTFGTVNASTPIAIASGGTGASTAAAALTSLGAVPLNAQCVNLTTNNYCLTFAPYNASNAGGTTTALTANGGVGTSFTVGSCSTFLPNQGVYIAGAGVASANYIGTISSCTGVTLVVSPATSTGVSIGATVKHDETAAFLAAIAACQTAGACTILLPDGQYNVNGPVYTADSSNAIIHFPSLAITSYPGLPITIQGFTPISSYGFAGGARITTDANANNLFGGFSSTSGLYNFISTNLTLRNLSLISTQTNPGVTMVNAKELATLQLDQVWCSSAAPATPSNTSGACYIFPQGGNDVRLTVDHTAAIGFYTGYIFGEHTQAGAIWGANLFNGFIFDPAEYTGGSSANGNSISVDYMWCQLCTNFIVAGGAQAEVNIQAADSEVSTTWTIYDPSNFLHGVINLQVPYNDGRSTSTTGAPAINGAGMVCINNLRTSSSQNCSQDAQLITFAALPSAGTGATTPVAQTGWTPTPSGGMFTFTTGTSTGVGDVVSMTFSGPVFYKRACVAQTFDNTAAGILTSILQDATAANNTLTKVTWYAASSLPASHSLTVSYTCK